MSFDDISKVDVAAPRLSERQSVYRQEELMQGFDRDEETAQGGLQTALVCRLEALLQLRANGTTLEVLSTNEMRTLAQDIFPMIAGATESGALTNR